MFLYVFLCFFVICCVWCALLRFCHISSVFRLVVVVSMCLVVFVHSFATLQRAALFCLRFIMFGVICVHCDPRRTFYGCSCCFGYVSLVYACKL